MRLARAGGPILAAFLLPLSLYSPAHATLDDLFNAVKFDDVAGVRHMLDQGYDVNSVDSGGTSLLMYAARERSNGVARVLVERHVKVNYRNDVHETALMFAALKGNLDLVKLLVAADAQIDQPGWTALHYAAYEGHTDICRFLLGHNADIDAKSPNGTTPLMLAARQGRYDTVKLLLWEVAEPNAKNESGATALSMALRNKNSEIATLLRQAGARE
jgi:uncharacterized protein